jgi:hypothetical protein
MGHCQVTENSGYVLDKHLPQCKDCKAKSGLCGNGDKRKSTACFSALNCEGGKDVSAISR